MYRRLKCLPGSIPGNQPYPHTFTVCFPVTQSSVPLCHLHRLCVFVFESLNESFIVVTCVWLCISTLKVCLMFFFLAAVMKRSLNHTLDTQSIECVLCVYSMCGCMGLCLCVLIWLHVCISVLLLKHYVEVSEAHGSSCCVPSYFPASVSTWPCAGCSPEILPRLENQPGRPGPSGCFASSGCS